MSDETDVEIKQRLGVDGHLWAVEFCKHYPNVDEGHAIGWFCNAMMATYDHRQKEIDELREQVRWWASKSLEHFALSDDVFRNGYADSKMATLRSMKAELTAAAARVMEVKG